MHPHILFRHLAALIAATAVHLTLSVFVLMPGSDFLRYGGLALMLLNMVLLLRYFSVTMRLVIAYRLNPKYHGNIYVIFNAVLGLIFNAGLIYISFLIVVNFIEQIALPFL